MKRDEQQARFLELEYFTLWGHGIRMAKKLCDEHGLQVDDGTILEQGRLAGAGMVAEQKKDARTKTIEKGKDKRTPKRATEAPTACEKCGAAMWDNREKKASGEYKSNAPDFKCKECEHPVWLDSKKPKTPAAVAESSDLPF